MSPCDSPSHTGRRRDERSKGQAVSVFRTSPFNVGYPKHHAAAGHPRGISILNVVEGDEWQTMYLFYFLSMPQMKLLNLPLVAFPCPFAVSGTSEQNFKHNDNIIDEPEYYFDSVHSQ